MYHRLLQLSRNKIYEPFDEAIRKSYRNTYEMSYELIKEWIWICARSFFNGNNSSYETNN